MGRKERERESSRISYRKDQINGRSIALGSNAKKVSLPSSEFGLLIWWFKKLQFVIQENGVFLCKKSPNAT